jgi:phosphoserine phosphatase
MANQGLARRSPALLIVAAATTFVTPIGGAAKAARDPLPSWRDTAPKRAIMEFVEKATRQGGPEFVPPGERIAVFDDDGTLWAEKPVPFEAAFAVDSVKAMASLHPEWKHDEPFASVLRGGRAGVAAAGEKGVVEIIEATHTTMSPDDFDKRVRTWIATARHPDTGLPYTSMVYQPMLELMAYLRDNGFETFIVSGGGVELMQPWVEEICGVPPWQVLDHRDPAGIQSRIGRRAIAAFGNSDGDLPMLEWATKAQGVGARFALVVHHDDARREYAYDRDDPLQKLDEALDQARRKRWTVVSMKNDWRTIFVAPPAREGAAMVTPPRASF